MACGYATCAVRVSLGLLACVPACLGTRPARLPQSPCRIVGLSARTCPQALAASRVACLVPLTLSQALAASLVACLVCPRILSLSHSVSLSLCLFVTLRLGECVCCDTSPPALPSRSATSTLNLLSRHTDTRRYVDIPAGHSAHLHHRLWLLHVRLSLALSLSCFGSFS